MYKIVYYLVLFGYVSIPMFFPDDDVSSENTKSRCHADGIHSYGSASHTLQQCVVLSHPARLHYLRNLRGLREVRGVSGDKRRKRSGEHVGNHESLLQHSVDQ